jgi:hypothetical protein
VPAAINGNKRLETALKGHVCMVDCSRHVVLDVTFRPKSPSVVFSGEDFNVFDDRFSFTGEGGLRLSSQVAA